MSPKISQTRSPRRLTGILRRLRHNEDGIAALEFAWVAPVMVALYMGAVELHHALSASRRVTDLASATADLVAQSSDMSSGMSNVFDAASLYLDPYGIQGVKVTVTSICHDKDNNGRVDWSSNHPNGGVHSYGHGDAIDLPVDGNGVPMLTVKGSSLILAEVEYNYTSPMGNIVHNAVYADHYYLRPRLTETPSVINTAAGGNIDGCAASEFMN